MYARIICDFLVCRVKAFFKIQFGFFQDCIAVSRLVVFKIGIFFKRLAWHFFKIGIFSRLAFFQDWLDF